MDNEKQQRAAFYHARTVDRRREDVEFYTQLARERGGPALELACGTGRVYNEVLRAGIDVDGLDQSQASLSVLRDAVAEDRVEPTVWQTDMTDFTVDREYSITYCPFNSMQFLLSVESQLAALDCVYDALAPSGTFAFDVFVPDIQYIGQQYGTWETESVTFRDEECTYRSKSTLVDESRLEFVVEYEAIDEDGEVLFSGENQLKMFTAHDVELLARLSPFEDWSVTGDFTDEPLSDAHQVQVWRLHKRPSDA